MLKSVTTIIAVILIIAGAGLLIWQSTSINQTNKPNTMEKTTYNINSTEVSEQEFLALKGELEIDKEPYESENYTSGGPGGSQGSIGAYNAINKKTGEGYKYILNNSEGRTSYTIVSKSD